MKGDKHMEWEFNLPVKLVFGNGKRKDIEKYIDEIGGKNGVLVCGKSFEKNGVADEFVKMSGGKIRSKTMRDSYCIKTALVSEMNIV